MVSILTRLARVVGTVVVLHLVMGCDRSPSTAPDNTVRNARDSGPGAATPMEQGESKEDLAITAAVRKAILDDKSMSVDAQNCKVMTKDRVVTLRGPVESSAERDAIETKARAVAGVASVINELEPKH